MSKMLNMTSVVFIIVVVQTTLSTNAEEVTSKKKNDKARTPSTQISSATTFAPSKDEAGYGALLTCKSVQREIGLTDKQAKSIDALYLSQYQRNLPLLMDLRNNFRDPEKRAVVQAQLDALFQQFAQEIKAELSKTQAQRLTQISMQNAGLRAFLVPEVAEALNLAPDRQDAIKEIVDAMKFREKQLEVEVRQKDSQEILNFSGGSWEEFRKSKRFLARQDQYKRALAANHDEARREIFRLLTQRQKKKFEALLGSPFDPEKHRRPDDQQPDTK